MNYILSLLLLISSSSMDFLSDNNLPNNCEAAIENAKKDHAKNQLKYYTFGIALFPLEQVKRMHLEHQIEVISLGCMVDPDKICYNQYVDDMLILKTGRDFYSLAK